MLLNCDFTPDVTYKAIVKGYEQIPLEICQQFVQSGGEVYLEHRLKSFAAAELPDGSSGVKMSLISQNQPGETIEIFARALILAMPRRSLELLDPTGEVLDPRNRKVQTLIRTVTPVPMFKMFVSYHTPWWEKVEVTKGRSVTDLPVRQCYYSGTEGEQLKADRQNQNSVLLASYDDTLNVTFWEGLRDKKEEPPFETKAGYYGSDYSGSPDWHHYKAPAAMVREIQRQLQEMHGLSGVPEPYSAVYMDWGDDPYGGAVNFWNIHAKSWEVIPQIVHPQENVPVYICGEAYSDGQGWVEGALSTAEILLQDHFGLQPPDWVTEEG
ncbi:FAD-dependent oxidoreductase [Microcoleus sp. POL10_C6]|uniref:FAD-dependent oxidoreductase n=1 Tax=unclassified Microcoleus TaxID=2642155 RepID=UPI002FD15A9E